MLIVYEGINRYLSERTVFHLADLRKMVTGAIIGCAKFQGFCRRPNWPSNSETLHGDRSAGECTASQWKGLGEAHQSRFCLA